MGAQDGLGLDHQDNEMPQRHWLICLLEGTVVIVHVVLKDGWAYINEKTWGQLFVLGFIYGRRNQHFK